MPGENENEEKSADQQSMQGGPNAAPADGAGAGGDGHQGNAAGAQSGDLGAGNSGAAGPGNGGTGGDVDDAVGVEELIAIDAISFAARAGQVAAAEIFRLLTDVGSDHAMAWHRSGILPVSSDSDGSMPDWGRMERDIEALAAYVAERKTNDGERLRNWALQGDLAVIDGPWAQLPLADRLAWTMFAENCFRAWSILSAARAEVAADDVIEQVAQTLKREDSIFEETESLGDMIPGALEQMSETDKQRAVMLLATEKKAQHEADLAARRERDAAAKAAGWQTKRLPKPRPASEGGQ